MPVLKSLSDGMEKLRSNPIIAALALFIAAVGALATFTDSVSRLAEFFVWPGPEAARSELAKIGIPLIAKSLQEKARSGDLAAVKKLLQAGIPADAISDTPDSDSPNVPALAEAAARGDLLMVQTLLASHANPSAGNGAAMKAAADHGYTAVLEVLLKQHPSEETISEALVSAASMMKLDAVRLLAAQLAEPKKALSEALWRMSDSDGWGDEELAALDRALIQLGADPNFADADGVTPLMVAARGGSAAQVRALLEAGAGANARCACSDYQGGGWTPLGLAAQKGDTDKVSRLIVAGADVNARNGEGETALMLATRRPNIDAVKALLKAGADASARAQSGQSALDIALKGYAWPDRTVYFPELVQLLSSSGGQR
jgi:ankyrin repeat protein